jgi:hypothetical protein
MENSAETFRVKIFFDNEFAYEVDANLSGEMLICNLPKLTASDVNKAISFELVGEPPVATVSLDFD